MDEFILRALIGGIGIAIISGPVGCFIVWQRMAYFGAALSHATLLGIALGLFWHINQTLAMMGVAVILSMLLLIMSKHRQFSSDTLLGVLSHASLALGLVVLSLLPQVRIDLLAYLFGDILAISWDDILLIYLGMSLILIVLGFIWRPLLMLTLDQDLAVVDKINEPRTRFIFLLILSAVIAISMQLVGVLLIISLLIIPAASARRFSKSPEQMALLAVIFGILSVLAGLCASYYFDTPAGPSIVLSASLFFAFSMIKRLNKGA